MTDSCTFPTEEIRVLKISFNSAPIFPTMGDFQHQILYFCKKMFRQAKIVWGQFTPWHNATGTDHSLDSDISLVSRCNNITASFQHVQTFLQCSLAQLTVDEQRPQLTANVQKMTPAFICSHQQHKGTAHRATTLAQHNYTNTCTDEAIDLIQVRTGFCALDIELSHRKSSFTHKLSCSTNSVINGLSVLEL